MSRRSWPIGLWCISALVLATSDHLIGRALAAFLILWFLPGWLCLEALSAAPSDVIERAILACGLSFAWIILGLLYLAYLNIPLVGWHPIAISAVISLPAWLCARRRKLSSLSWPSTRMGFILAGVFVIAAAIRFIQLGYAEFHEDEVEVLSLAVRISKGEGYAVFLHRKGPLQVLVPLAFWLLTGPIHEGLARMPFAVANLLGVLTVTCLVTRIGGRGAGLVAGVLIALNGYLVAFSRMVQYQSFVFLLISLSVFCLWEVVRSSEKTLIFPGILCTGAGLLAHFDAVVYLPVIGYLAWQIVGRYPAARGQVLVSSVIVLGLCLSFYVPYGFDPQFQHTLSYLSEDRVGTQWLYNNLPGLLELDRVYSSRYYLPVVVALVAGLFVTYAVKSTRFKGLTMLPLLVGVVATSVASRWPELYKFDGINLAILPGLCLTGGVFWALRKISSCPGDVVRDEPGSNASVGFEVLALWWAVPALAYTFLVRAPGTHVYVMYPGLAALAGLGALSVWSRMTRQMRILLVSAGSTCLALILGYQSVIFLLPEALWSDVCLQWKDNWAGWIYGALPKPASYFGYPRRVGWKGAGYLMDRGIIPDDFRSIGVEFSVPVWYMFDTPRSCYSDAALYLVVLPPDAEAGYIPKVLPSKSDYGHIATIYVEGRPRLSLWQKGVVGMRSPAIYKLEELSSRFDEIATIKRFSALDSDMIQTNYRFATVAKLLGYRVQPRPVAGVVRASPGDELMLWVYWQSIQPLKDLYRAFVHLGENPVWTQQDDDPACRLPTLLWRARQVTRGQFRLSIPREMPSGRYPLNLGLYDPVTMERLSVVGEHGQELGDAVLLVTVEIERPPQ